MSAFELVTRLENLRKKAKIYNRILAVFLLICAIVSLCFWRVGMFLVPIATVIGLLWRNKPEKEFKELYKMSFVPAVLGEFFENPSYVWDKGFSEETVKGFGISQMGNRFKSEDYISGTYKGVSFEQSDVKIQYETSGKNKRITTYFSGRMFVFSFDKYNTLPVQVFSDNFRHRAERPDRGIRMNNVEMESVKFNEMFDIKAAREYDAFYILTPQMMEKISELQNKFESVAFNFSGNKLFVGLKCGTGAFDADIFKPVSYPEEREKIRRDVKVIMDIIDIMELVGE